MGLNLFRTNIRFDRHELSGSFGDVGTDLPLLMGMILAVGLNSAEVFVMFGVMQILTGVIYGLPMPVQPLKAMAVLVITQKIGGDVLAGAGLAIGGVMLVLSLTGAMSWLETFIPKCVVRGIQFGLGLSLAALALKNYLPAMEGTGYALAALAFGIVIFFGGNRKIPIGLVVILLGALFAAMVDADFSRITNSVGWTPPTWHTPSLSHIATGFVVLALPQLPLSFSNSVIATAQTVRDLFPEKRLGVARIGLTYGIMNLVAPFFGGVPVCHGCGGLAGHHAFGARTGGSVVIYGSIYVVLGLFFSGSIHHMVQVFPQPVLAVILFVESLALILFLRDTMGSKRDAGIAVIVGLLAFAIPQGFIVGLVVGCLLYYASAHLTFLNNSRP